MATTLAPILNDSGATVALHSGGRSCCSLPPSQPEEASHCGSAGVPLTAILVCFERSSPLDQPPHRDDLGLFSLEPGLIQVLGSPTASDLKRLQGEPCERVP